jgi:hypothetical protein
MYKLLLNSITEKKDCVQRLSDNAFIPFDPANTDFVEYQKWLSEGNTLISADTPTEEQ